MKLLLLDFLRRRWWMMAAIVLLTFFSAVMGAPAILSILVFLPVLNDMQHGLLHTTRTLPISRRMLAISVWFIVVLMLPLIALIVLPLGVLLEAPTPFFKAIGVSKGEPWFAAAAAWWLQLGFGAALFLLATATPVRPPVTVWGKVRQISFALCLPLAIFGSLWFLWLLPRSAVQLGSLHWTLFALVPVLVLLSVLAASVTMKRHLRFRGACRIPAPEVHERTDFHALAGMSLLLVKMHALALGIYALIMAFTWVIALATDRTSLAQNLQRADHQTLMFVIIITGGIIPNTFNLRMLRVMPLSTKRLTAILLSVPLAIGLFSAVIAVSCGAFASDNLPLLLNVLVKTATIAGLGGMMLTVSFYLSSNSVLAVLVMATVLATSAFDLIPEQPPLVTLLLGLAATVGAFILLHRILKRSSKPYQPRRPFGMQLRQPSMAR